MGELKHKQEKKNRTGQTDLFLFSSVFLTKVKHPDEFSRATGFGGITSTALL